MTGTEPFNENGSPPHCEARTMKFEMEDKMVQIKKENSQFFSPSNRACLDKFCFNTGSKFRLKQRTKSGHLKVNLLYLVNFWIQFLQLNRLTDLDQNNLKR